MSLARLMPSWCTIILAGCVQPLPQTPTSPVADPQVGRGFAFAEAQCSGCHALKRGEASPNPQAPGFAAVANEMAFTTVTLREFFLDGHDFPGMMSIQLEEEEADMVTAYIMSLRERR